MDYLLDTANGAAKAASDAANAATDAGSQSARLLMNSIELGLAENAAVHSPHLQSQARSRLQQRKNDLAGVPLGSSLGGAPITAPKKNDSSPSFDKKPGDEEVKVAGIVPAISKAAPAVAAMPKKNAAPAASTATAVAGNEAKVAEVILTFLFRSGINVLKVGKSG